MKTSSPVHSTHTRTHTQTAQCGTSVQVFREVLLNVTGVSEPVALATRSRSHQVTVDQTCPTECHSEPCGFKIIGKKENNFLFSYIDALRTVHLVGCEAITVSSCLTDNMAKGIHLKTHNKQHNKVRADAHTHTNKQRKVDEKAQAAKQNLTERSTRSNNTLAMSESKKTTIQSKQNHIHNVNT